jgi:hypothetical protein
VRCWDKTLGEREKKRTKKTKQKVKMDEKLAPTFLAFSPRILKTFQKKRKECLVNINCELLTTSLAYDV